MRVSVWVCGVVWVVMDRQEGGREWAAVDVDVCRVAHLIFECRAA